MDLMADLLIPGVKILVILNAILIMVAMLVWAERRVSAFIQDRLGPNRVGPAGLLQSFADLLKFVFKEDVIPGHVNKPFFVLAPALAVMPALITIAVVPFASNLLIADLDVGILFVFAISSLGVYGITIGGWSSNSKYSLLGGIRSSAQMVSYEICLGLAVVGVFMLSGTLRLQSVVEMQGDGIWLFGSLHDGVWKILDWNIVKQPLGFLLFLVSGLAETNRTPFDLPEAEQELAAGYHTEYSSMKFALFFLGEYAAMFVISAVTVTLFLGGWTLFGLESLGWLVQLLIFTGKTLVLLFVFIWVRWTIPRFRYDQLMRLGWQVFLPLGLLNVVLTGVLKLVFQV
ncbi:MAG: NADH-quinone oxidoreductase subunit NuoH [Planctomycetota bacterium]|jgi:NADH-quinone oxidoreductase subunit H